MQSDLRKAVSMNLYGTLTRSTRDWKPSPLLCKRMNIPNPYPEYVYAKQKTKLDLFSYTIICFSDAYDDSKESKKSRRQMCSNLFEHLFTQSTTESSVSSEQPSVITPSETTKTPQTVAPVIPAPAPPPAPPKFQFATIESFEKVN